MHNAICEDQMKQGFFFSTCARYGLETFNCKIDGYDLFYRRKLFCKLTQVLLLLDTSDAAEQKA